MRRAVITGIGVICSIGRDTDQYWESLAGGHCGIEEITLFDTTAYRVKIAGQVKDVVIDRNDVKGKRFSRGDQLGMIALEEAVRSSGIQFEREDPDMVSVVIGGGSGGLNSAELFKRTLLSGKKPYPTLLVPFSSSSFTDMVAFSCNSRGLRTTISTACSSSSTAIGLAGELVVKGKADLVITGGTESLSETTFAGFSSLRAVDDQPCRPFDKQRKGISLGEGAALFIVEERERARKRKADIFAEVAGYGIAGDAHHVTAPEPEGKGVVCAIEMAIKSAGIPLDAVGYINAHGTGTQANDLAETKAIKRTFRERAYSIPVSSTKSMIGHCLGAAGALETAAAIMPIQKGLIPPTANYRNRDPECDLDYVPVPVKRSIDVVLSLSLAFGGNNTALLLRKHI